MAESKEELKSLLMKLKEESEKASLKPNIQKTKKASSPITSRQIDGKTTVVWSLEPDIPECEVKWALTVWITANCGKFLKRWEYKTTLPAS